MSTLSNDLIRGSRNIAAELGLPQAAILELAKTSDAPIFRIGAVHFARRSTLAMWIATLEFKALMRKPDLPDVD